MIPQRKPSDSSWTYDFNSSVADDLELHAKTLDSGRTDSSSRDNEAFQLSSEEPETFQTISKSISQAESQTQAQALTTLENQNAVKDDKLTLTTDFENETRNRVTECRSNATQETPIINLRYCINQSSPKFFCSKTMLDTSELNQKQSNSQKRTFLNKSLSRSQESDYTPAVDKTDMKQYFESIPPRKGTQNDEVIKVKVRTRNTDSNVRTMDVQNHSKVSQIDDRVNETKQGIEVTCPLFAFQSKNETKQNGQEERNNLPSQSHKGDANDSKIGIHDIGIKNETTSDDLSTQREMEKYEQQNEGILRHLCKSNSDINSVFCKVGKWHFSKKTFWIAIILFLAIMISAGFVLGVAIIGPNDNQQETHQVTTDQITIHEDIYQTAPPFFFVWKTQAPSIHPTEQPSISYSPTNQPTHLPSETPTEEPSFSQLPSNIPTLSVQPTITPSSIPSSIPTPSQRTIEITTLVLSIDYNDISNKHLADKTHGFLFV